MKTLKRTLLTGACFLAIWFAGGLAQAQTTYNQALTNNFVTGANAIEKNATANTAENFRTAVAAAWTNGAGGVFNLPTTVAAATTVYRGVYGAGKRVQITSSVNMQNITSGTFTVASAPNGTTSSANQSDYTLTLGLFDTNTGLPLLDETIKEIGLPILSRNAAGYPMDLRVTVSFSDGSTQAVTAAIATGAGVDDTFFGFTAPNGLGIASVRLQSFAPGTETPVADRIGWDDFGFITGAATVVPPPQIVNLSPAAYAFHNATNGIHFNALTFVPIAPTDISLVVNAVDVSAQMIVSGDPTNYSVSYSGLVPDQEYQIVIGVTNSGGVTVLERTFYTHTNAFQLYDSQGFVDDTLYPLGALQNVTHERATWVPNAAEPAQIVSAAPPQEKVLERLGTGASRADFLVFPPVSSGRIIVEFDAFISTTVGRTMDICLQPTTGGNTMGCFLAWGEPVGKLAYFDNVVWQPLADLQTDWHHVTITNYLSGPAAGRYDVYVNGVAVAQKIPWRNAAVGSAFNQFRIQTQNTAALFEYGRIDNLVITAAPEDPNAFPPPAVVPVSPVADRAIVRTSEGLRFNVTSQLPVAAANIGVLLNGADVTGALQVTGPETARNVAYSALQAETNYVAQINATNSAGAISAALNFISTEQAWLYDPSAGWAGPWQYSSGLPEVRPADPLEAGAPPVRLDILGGARNLMRQYTSSSSVDLSQSHYIRWKFRLPEPDFAANFIAFNDRVHFFGRNAPRLTASTDAATSWAISATGAEQSAGSGISAGQRFYIFDNLDGTRAYNLANLVDSQIQLFPDNVYAFEVRIFPQDQTYAVAITNETTGASFRSAAPHKFRAADVTATSHTLLHFGVQAAVTTTPRAFDFGPIAITSAAAPAVTLVNPGFNAFGFTFAFQSRNGINHVAQYKDNVTSTVWTDLETVTGDGSLKTVTHTNPPAGPLFYRIDSRMQ